MDMFTLLLIGAINGIVWFVLGYKLGKDQGQLTSIDHYETELLDNSNGKWFLRYTPYQANGAVGSNRQKINRKNK